MRGGSAGGCAERPKALNIRARGEYEDGCDMYGRMVEVRGAVGSAQALNIRARGECEGCVACGYAWMRGGSAGGLRGAPQGRGLQTATPGKSSDWFRSSRAVQSVPWPPSATRSAVDAATGAIDHAAPPSPLAATWPPPPTSPIWLSPAVVVRAGE
jgi:hypothetical protein